MTPEQLEMERFKMQKQQLYLQVASVLISAILLYTFISGKGKVQEVDSDFPNNGAD